MKLGIFPLKFFTGLFAGLFFLWTPIAKSAIGDFITSISSPNSGPSGITWDGTNLWVIDQVGAPDTVYRIDPATGNILSSFLSPVNTAQGLAWNGSSFFATSGTSIFEFDNSGALLNSNNFGSNLFGIEWNGSKLLTSNVSGGTIDFIDPTTWGITSSIPSPGGGITGITWDGTSIWAVQSATKTVFELNPGTGAIVSSFSDPGAGTWKDLTIGQNGNFYFADDGSNQIRTYVSPLSTATPLDLSGPEGTVFILLMMLGVYYYGRRVISRSKAEGEQLASCGSGD